MHSIVERFSSGPSRLMGVGMTRTSRSLHGRVAVLSALVGALLLGACAVRQPPTKGAFVPTPPQAALLDTIGQRTFAWFWETTDPRTGLTPDRWPRRTFSSVAAIGFALTAYPIGAERGWISRAQAAERTLTTLRYLYTLPQGDAVRGVAGHQGFFYHFLEFDSGHRYRDVELSTIDTGLLLGGALFCQSYFTDTTAVETQIRAVADSLYRRVNWPWFVQRPSTLSMGWRPERGYIRSDWTGYNEAMLLIMLGLGSPTYPLDDSAWSAWTSTYRWNTVEGQPHLDFAPLFGHQYSHSWIDFRGIQDAFMRGRGIDYFENSRRATLSQQQYAIRNPMGWRGYSAEIWGLTASDGPFNGTMTIDGVERRFHTYWARGISTREQNDDGTIAPTAALASIAFTPDVSVRAAVAMREQFNGIAWGRYGFLDAFNPTLRVAPAALQHGHVVEGYGWVDDDYLGIDQGPILVMLENWRTELVWKTMRRNPYIVRGLQRAGFRGGWLEQATRKQ
jgi:hypothetical protein